MSDPSKSKSETNGPGKDGPGKDDGTVPAAHKVIEAFGGIRPMAQKLGVAASTVQGWKERGVIPSGRHAKILEIAETDKLALDAETVAASAQMPEDPTGKDEGEAPEKAEAEAAEPSTLQEAEATTPEISASQAASSVSEPGAGSGWPAPFLAGVLVLALGIGAAIVGRELWLPLVDGDDGGSSESVAALESRIASLESRPGPGQRMGQLEGRIETLTQELSQTRGRLDEAVALSSGAVSESAIQALEAQINRELAERGESLDQIIARLDRVESHQVVRPVSASDLALTLSLGSLRERIFTGQPFAETLEAALRAARERPEVEAALEPLREVAETGVLRIVRLQESFRAASRDIVSAAAGEGEENALLAGIKRRLSQVVTVRPSTENAAEGSPELAVGLAEDALAAGNLGDALAALEALPESAAAAAEPWMTEARRRHEAEQAVEAATLAFLAALQAAN